MVLFFSDKRLNSGLMLTMGGFRGVGVGGTWGLGGLAEVCE